MSKTIRPKKTHVEKLPLSPHVVDLLAAAYMFVREDAARKGHRGGSDAAKVLEAVMVTVLRGDWEALRVGARWARGVVPEVSPSPQTALVLKLRDHVARARTDGGTARELLATTAAIEVVVSGVRPGLDANPLAKSIANALAKRAERSELDDELDVKAILRAAGWNEREAGNAISAALKGR